MSEPHGSDPGTQWQPPGEGAENQSSDQPTQAASPWQQQPPTQEAAWHPPAYTPPEYPQYQQPTEPAYPHQYPPAAPGYGQPAHFGAQPPGFGAPGQYAQPGQYGQYPPPPGQYGQPGQYGPPGQYPQQFQPYEQPGTKGSVALIGGIAGVIGVLILAAILVTGFLWPAWLVTTKLDVNKAQTGVQQILTDETNGYGARNVKDVKCNNGADPTVKKGGTFDCSVSIDGAQKRVTVTFQDDKGTYEVGRPQ
ncbi:DUF4333 domain-containing protein [Mycobacterium haemophilum]|uniref:DUF4333 domain-containing protein n=1 Tax=Mycobacterium haemophilum TaxID=29311 RepID=A0A0I9TE34_9MYCO|nr:DUF4333 domain-containing protein [Mycobacterium haemophilum]AKN16910.1 hypothetical protein B586_10705 [Mycobacterium haemophilum DSM 44634]KLO26420.1 hypothetical protein ABH39_17705 [Mycobacterium haemophilum]KLO34640.1 hypothetical protein ABH38_18165 [Mycobacterium haemophilum]KLO39605.1 hypothetical protein ABH37_17770 [Mycobacterium haemophilum]KLO46536.1 hypothetical protein ABH36_17880 [Mycobacterium haemophilum]